MLYDLNLKLIKVKNISKICRAVVVTILRRLHHRFCHRRRLHFVTASRRPSVSFLSISASSRYRNFLSMIS